MNPRHLILLSPYQIPGQNPLMLGNDEVAAFLNGYSALWHPAALAGAAAPPKVASPYDHEQPAAGHLYAVPESPPLVLPDDWEQRVREAGAATFRTTADRPATMANLGQALQTLPSETAADPAQVADDRAPSFFGVGFGFMQVNALFEAMEHENLLAVADFWQDVQAAVTAQADPDPEAYRRHLQSAAEKLLAARQVLYPVTIHLLGIALPDSWPAALDRGLPVNVIASGAWLEQLGREHPERLATLRERVANDLAEVCGGPYGEREDALLPVESQLWNLLKGLAVSRNLLNAEVRVFARKRFGFHPQLPLFLGTVGLQRVLLLTFDEAALPAYNAAVVNWPAPDGTQVEGFARTPYPADSPNTYFHATHYLHRTIMQDHAATLALVHGAAPTAPWYEDWLELSRLAPVLGQWTTLTRYFNEVLAGEHAPSSSPDEFHADYLSERISAGSPKPVSGFARQVRRRRRLDTLWTLAAVHRGLTGTGDPPDIEDRLAQLEDRIEGAAEGVGADSDADLLEAERQVGEALAERLLSRAAADTLGFLILNPCSFARRVALELEGVTGPLPIAGPLKACQLDGGKARLVAEVPALGFAWVPASGPPATPAMPMRMRLADARHVRNEFFEAEIDPVTGGLRGLWDPRTRINRIGQQLVFNPGSTMRAREVQVTSSGPALGEVVSEGVLLGEQDQVLAKFRQRFRAWLGRPVLDLRIDIEPELGAAGYAWHAYFGARFAWRDERALMLRGVNGTGYVTSHTRPQTPDYLELRTGRQNTVIFPGGLPFHQRHGSRMLDVILVPEGEKTQGFDLALGLDREHPMQTALGMVTPIPWVAVAKGPPQVGASGWLFHLDSPNLLLTSMRPAPGGADAIVARMLECGLHGGQAELRCVRDPRHAVLVNARGETVRSASTQGDSVLFDVSSGDLVQLRVEFSGS